jgi:hypothetical protein
MSRLSRPQDVAIPGILFNPEMLTIFGVHVIKGTLVFNKECSQFLSPVRCLDSFPDGSRYRTIWTDSGKVRIHSKERLLS